MIIVSCAIIFQRNKILVTQRNSESEHALKWEFPGGKLKPEEAAEDCIVREIKEELDINIKIREKLTHVNYDFGFKKIQLVPFLCTIKSGNIKLTEHKEMKWIELGQLHEIDLIQADRELIELKKNQLILEKYFRKNVHNS